jgi:hypothetical protein
MFSGQTIGKIVRHRRWVLSHSVRRAATF